MCQIIAFMASIRGLGYFTFFWGLGNGDAMYTHGSFWQLRGTILGVPIKDSSILGIILRETTI